MVLVVLVAASCKSGDRTDDEKAETVQSTERSVQPGLQTSRPGAATLDLVKSSETPITALTFFADGPVKDQVYGYLRELADATGRTLSIRELDRLVHAEQAKEFRVSRDGTVVFSREERSESFTLHTDERHRERALRELDARVSKALAKLARVPGQALIVIGAPGPEPGKSYQSVRRAIEQLGYRVKVTSATEEPSIPDDVMLVVFIDAGARPIDATLDALVRHATRGRPALIALEPKRETSLGQLGEHFGLRFDSVPLVDDKQFLRARNDASDRLNIITNDVVVHRVTKTLVRASARTGVMFSMAGSLESSATPGAMSPTFVVRSMPSAFRDIDRDLQFDDASETRQAHALVAALTGKSPATGTGDAAVGRAVVFSDTTWLHDRALRSVPANQALLFDALAWLAGQDLLVSDETEDRAGSDSIALTSYPLRDPADTSARSDTGSFIWRELAIEPAIEPGGAAARTISKVRLRRSDGTLAIEVTRGANGLLWGRAERMSAGQAQPTVAEFPVGERGEDLLQALASLEYVQALGQVSADSKPEFGLTDTDTSHLTVTFGDRSRSLIVGNKVYGSADRYVLEPSTGHVYVVAGRVLRPLEAGEGQLRLRELISQEPEDVAKVTVVRADQSRELLRETRSSPWIIAGVADDDGLLASHLVELVFQLRPLAFARRDEVPAARAIGRVVLYSSEGASLDEIQVFVAKGDGMDSPDYYVQTPRTRVLARIPAFAGRRLAGALEQLFAVR